MKTLLNTLEASFEKLAEAGHKVAMKEGEIEEQLGSFCQRQQKKTNLFWQTSLGFRLKTCVAAAKERARDPCLDET